MRMWSVDPKVLCRQHLLGEHKEMHMFAGTYRRRISILGYITGGMVETHRIKERHDELVLELERRNYSHFSPIEENPTSERLGSVDGPKNLEELARRCEECRVRQEEYGVRAKH